MPVAFANLAGRRASPVVNALQETGDVSLKARLLPSSCHFWKGFVP